MIALIKKLEKKLKNFLLLSSLEVLEINKIISEFKRNKPISIKDVEIQNGSNISIDSIIGAHSYIGFNCTITKSNIGRYCSIANNVSIGVGEHKIERISTSSLFYEHPYEVLTEGDCNIGNDVWVGTNSVIRRGVTIGDGVIIGANSFVNKNLPDFCIAVGSPAKILRFRFSEDQILVIKNSKWWDLEIDEAAQKISIIQNNFK